MPTCRYFHYLKPEHDTTHCGMDVRMNSIRGWVHGNHVSMYVHTYIRMCGCQWLLNEHVEYIK